jgi:SAM-dependent methyltransferase
MGNTMDLKSTYDRIAGDWTRDHKDDTLFLVGTDTFLSFLRPNASVLDVGCGSGEKTKYIFDHGFEVTGIDFSDEMIRLAKARVPRGTFFVQDILRPLELGATYDGIFASAVLLHIRKEDIAEVLRNVVSVLKPGGYFYAAVKQRAPGEPEEVTVKENDYGYEYERFFSNFTLDELNDLLTDAGLQFVYSSVTNAGRSNWIQIIAEKEKGTA